MHEFHQFRPAERFQDIYLASAEEGAIYFKRRIFSCGADQGYNAFFYCAQQGILLTLVKTVNFIDKENDFLLFPGFFNYLPHFLYSRRNGAQGIKGRMKG